MNSVARAGSLFSIFAPGSVARAGTFFLILAPGGAVLIWGREATSAPHGEPRAAHGKFRPPRPAQISSTIGHRAFKQVSFGALEFPGAHACPRQLDTGLKSGARASRATIGEYELRGARREFVFNFCAGLRGARRDVFFEFCEVCLLRTHFGSN